MKIRNMNLQDLDEVIFIHMNSFKNFFLSSLGEDFLYVYYKSVLLNSNSVCKVYVNTNNKILGFIVGSTDSRFFYRKLIISNLYSFLILGIKLFFKNPLFIYRLIMNLDKKKKNKEINGAEILSISVLNNVSSKGIGSKLLFEFEKKIKKNNIESISLTTDKYNNSNVLKFYDKNNYKIYYEFKSFPNRIMYKLIKKI